jgi:hypothetical protein
LLQLVIGNYGLSKDGAYTQMGMWAMVASSLLMSVDLRTIDSFSKELLLNKRVIAINQDPLGVQGKVVLKYSDGDLLVWKKPLVVDGSFAIAVVYMKQVGHPVKVTFSLKEIGLMHSQGYNVTEVFSGKTLEPLKPHENFTCSVNPSGIVLVTTIPL